MSLIPILEVDGLSKSYRSGDRELVVLKDVSLSVHSGDTCAIIGPSGSGKTTLLGLCAGLDKPSHGSVRLDGRDLAMLNEDQRARLRNQAVGFVFQSFQLLPTLTALENVMVPLELRGGDHAEDQGIELLRKVGLEERMHHYPAQLSGGEQQRVAIARAFITRPRLLFADEPTGNLDTETGHAVIELLFELNRVSGAALMLVTHDTEIAGRARRVVKLKAGMVIGDEVKNA